MLDVRYSTKFKKDFKNLRQAWLQNAVITTYNRYSPYPRAAT